MDYQAYFDPNLNITWAAADGITTVKSGVVEITADYWIDNFSINGISEWRFPLMDVNGDGTVIDCTGGGVIGCADNEFGFLYWEESISIANPSPFDISYPSEIGHWSGSPFVFWWAFDFSTGNQFMRFREDPLKTWTVRSGDVSSVPVPAATWLFGSGLVGLLAVARRRH